MRLILLLFTTVLCLAAPGISPAAPAGESATSSSLTLPRSGQLSCYGTKGTFVECKGSGQDGEQQRGVVWPSPRFKIKADGTFIDKLTGLIWLADGKCLNSHSWLGAKKKLTALNGGLLKACSGYRGTYKDWRLATVQELAGLLDSGIKVPADYLKSRGVKMFAGPYWSATSYRNPLDAWLVDFSNGKIVFASKIKKSFVLPVRGGRPAVKSAAVAGSKSRTRFVNNHDGTVSDISSGLMWLRDTQCLRGLNWSGALKAAGGFSVKAKAQCQGYNGNYRGWLLPDRVELMSLVNFQTDFPAAFKAVFADTPSGDYWTSTTAVASPREAYTINFDTGALVSQAKDRPLGAILVRRISQTPLPVRITTMKARTANNQRAYTLTLAPKFSDDIAWPPYPRFMSNGDGTSMDRLTGITWLSDGNCFGRQSWPESFKVIKKFNHKPAADKCAGYDGTFSDWQLPTIEDLETLVNPAVRNSADWLNTQGVKNVQGGGDYWSATETSINMYYAHVITFGPYPKTVKDFPKSMKFFIWPRRASRKNTNRKPLLTLTINALSGALRLSQGTPLSMVVFLHTFGLMSPADFWFWYDTPDGHKLWLSKARGWSQNKIPVYHGPLFNLRHYEIYRSAPNHLTPGRYVFHFVVDAAANGILDKDRFEAKAVVTITAKGILKQKGTGTVRPLVH
ncbi:MAG TPA: DUF1566 domain-containing protein [Desulfobacterales bacterium]|nr:DUF1566 domain-containing protein [Desulfobacterales bacterium]